MSNIKLFLLLFLQISILITSKSKYEEIYLKSTEQVDIYTLNSIYYGYLEIPKDEDHLRLYQIPTGKEGQYTVQGYSIIVNEFGTITPKNTTIYYYINGTISEKYIPGLEINKTDISYSIGNSVVICKVGDRVFNITIIVHDYAKVYTEETLQKYVEENVKDQGTQLEQYTKITEYISQFPYSGDIESYITLIIFKKGNSWAASSAIDYMAKYAGIKSHIRVSENDNDKEIILRSVVALINNQFYVAKILYNESLEHNYTIYTIPQGYSYRKSEDENNIIIYQYDGYEEEITIPDKLDDLNVIGLDKKCFANGVKFSDTKITKITIPDSILSIGDGTFSDLNGLKEITIPKSVNNIGNNVFEGCNSLQKINVDNDNSDYCSDEGILYNKNKTTLITYPPGIKDNIFNTSEILEKIDNYSFYKNKFVNKIYLSKSIKYIGGKAFGDSNLEEIYFKGDPPYIGDDAFLFLFITVYYPKNNKKWDSIINSENYGSLEISWVGEEGEEEGEEGKEEEGKEEEGGESKEEEGGESKEEEGGKSKEEEEGGESKEEEEGKEEGGGEGNKENGQDKEESEIIIWVLIAIAFGIVIIILAILFFIIISKKKDTTSEQIERIDNDGLLKEKNENE